MSGLVAVRLQASYRIFNSGEVAGFPPDEAADLVERGLALPLNVPVSSAEETDDAPKTAGKKK